MAETKNALEWLEEGLSRAIALLPSEGRAKLKELSDPTSLLGFAIVLGVWGGLQLTPLGVAADVILGIWGSIAIGADAVELVAASIEASEADTEAKMVKASKRLAAAIVEVGIDTIALLVGNPLFKQLRKMAETIRPAVKGAKIARSVSPIAEVATKAANVTGGAGAVVAAPVVGNAALTVLKIGLPIAGALALFAVLSARKTTRRRGER